KVYPHPVSSGKVGGSMAAGAVYNAVIYRCFSELSETRSGHRMSFFSFEMNGVYVFIDYSGSMSDKVDLSDHRLNGKQINVIESSNVELMSDVYNNGITTKSTYIEGETCYIVLKIS